MGVRLRAFDWHATSLGAVEQWPAALRVSVDSMLSSKFATCIFWGPELLAIYNDGYRVMLGGKPEALGQSMHVTWSEAWQDLKPIAQRALKGESTFIENFLVRVNRRGHLEDAYFTFCYSPVFDERGDIVGIIDTVVETTASVAAEREAAKERARQQRLLQQMPGFVAVLSGPTHVFDYVNDAYVKISGPRNFVGRTVREVFPELADQGFYEMLDHVYATSEPIRASGIPIKLEGEPDLRFIDLLYEPVRNEQGVVSGIFVGGYDITDRKLAEAKALASEAGLRELNAELEQRVIERTLARGKTWQMSPEILGVINSEGYFESSNPAKKTVLGWSEAEISSTRFFDFIHPDDLDRTNVAWRDAMERSLPALRFENRYKLKSGGWRWLSWVAVPEDGKIYCSARDVQEEKERAEELARRTAERDREQAELAEAQDALRQAQKMEAVGQLTGGIAHDFNNLLAAISGSLQVMRVKLERNKPDGLERYVEMGERSVRSAAALTQRLLAFSRRQTLDPKPVDLNRLVASMEDMVRRSAGPSVVVEVVGAGGLWATRADPSQLENALLNLCINARDAMLPLGGRLTIETANKWLDDRAATERELPPGQYVSLCVTDTGSGMSPEVVERIFDPFYTTKPIGQGTGLGLSMVYGFVRQSGGQVRVYSEVGQGTTMCLYLPRHVGDAAHDDGAESTHGLAQGDGETVLVIEDEETIRTVLAEIMTEAGYKVLLAEDGPAGLRFLQSKTRIDLLVTDVGLPGGLNGRQVADAGRAMRAGLKVLFITGYAENAAVGNGLMEHGMQVITKPFEIAGLMNKVREMLDSN